MLEELGRDEDAADSYDSARQKDPQNEEILIAEGKTLSRLGQYEEAIRIFDLALIITPENGETPVRERVCPLPAWPP